MKEVMYGVGNLQSSPALKTFYNKALLSTNGADFAHDLSLVRGVLVRGQLQWGLGSHTSCLSVHTPLASSHTTSYRSLIWPYVHVQIMIAAILLSK